MDSSQAFVRESGLSEEPMATTDMPDPRRRRYENYSFAAPPQIYTTDPDSYTFDFNASVDFFNGPNMSPFSFPDATIDSREAEPLFETGFEEGTNTWNLPPDLDLLSHTPQMNGLAIPSTDRSQESNSTSFSWPSSKSQHNDNCTQKLSALAADFHRHLNMVNQGPWVKNDPQKDRQSCLKNYPIGDALHLSQELISVLRCVSLNVYVCSESERNMNDAQQIRRSPELAEETLHGSRSRDNSANPGSYLAVEGSTSPSSNLHQTSVLESAEPSSRVDVDTPIALLIMNCYVSLIRIYSIVFAYLHQHLRSVSWIRPTGSVLQPLPGLQFGELQPSNEAYTRTYTAFRMLLDTLGRSEEMLNLPRKFRCVRVCADGSLSVGPQSDQASVKATGRNDTLSTSEGSSSSADRASPLGASSTGLVGIDLVEAVLRQEALIGAGNGGGGLTLLRQNIRGVKRTLRQKMAL